MKTEEIIKIILILGVLYLLFNCTITEGFINSEKIKLALLSANKAYCLVSFFDLKDEYKKILLEILKDEYNEELKVNKTKTRQEDKKNTSFLFAGIEDALINATSDTITKLTPNVISKIPVLIISNDKVNEYTKSIFEIPAPSDRDKGLSPEPGKYIYWNPFHKMLFYSGSEMYRLELKGLHQNIDKNKFELEPLKFKYKDITPTKIVEKTRTSGNINFTYYLLSNTEGTSFVWKWYTNDITKIL